MAGRILVLAGMIAASIFVVSWKGLAASAPPRTAVTATNAKPATSQAAAAAAAAANPALERRLERAKATYAAATEASRKRLDEEFETIAAAYERAGNGARAEATRDDRRQFFAPATQPAATAAAPEAPPAQQPEVKDGWTILFRSSNPLLWNIDVRNRDSYAVALFSAPSRFRYLRLRRADTGEFVILPTENIPGRVYPADKPWFRGDKALNRHACALGIVDVDRTVDANQVPVLEIAPEGAYSGWGFAQRAAGDGQAWVWNGIALEETVMEIAVTARELTPDEKACLVGR